MITGKNLDKKQIKQLAKKKPFQNKTVYNSLKDKVPVNISHNVRHFDALKELIK